MRLLSETSVFKFLRRAVDEAYISNKISSEEIYSLSSIISDRLTSRSGNRSSCKQEN